jgi:hypothetical protein
MDPIYLNFISWWPPHMLIIGQPYKMLIDLRNGKGNEKEDHSYPLHQCRFWSVALIRNVSEPRVCILHIRALAQGTSYSNVNASLLPQSTLLAEATVTHRLVIPMLNQLQAAVLSQILFSITSGFVA